MTNSFAKSVQEALDWTTQNLLDAKNPHLDEAAFKMDIVQAMMSKIAIRRATVVQRPEHDRLKYLCLEHWVLTHGRPYQARLRPKGVRPGPVKQCYANSAKAVLRESYGLSRYVEGFYLRMIDTQHAWNLDDEGNVVDLTIRKHESNDDILTTQYFGVEIKRDYLVKALSESGHWSVLDNWKQGYPLLKNDDLLKEVLA